jgi:ATP-dependent Clp protease adapter protein ClpS
MASTILPNPVDSNQENDSDDEYCIICYNNETNTFDQVIAILSSALNIDIHRAEMHAWDIHLLGKANVYYGSQADCEQKAKVISSIGIKTEVSN